MSVKHEKLNSIKFTNSPWTLCLNHTIEDVPRCHDREQVTVYKELEKAIGGESTVVIMEIGTFDEHGNITITNDDQLTNQVYYADDDKRILLLKALRSGVMDQYDECPPHGIDKEIIEDLEKIIKKLGRR